MVSGYPMSPGFHELCCRIPAASPLQFGQFDAGNLLKLWAMTIALILVTLIHSLINNFQSMCWRNLPVQLAPLQAFSDSKAECRIDPAGISPSHLHHYQCEEAKATYYTA